MHGYFLSLKLYTTARLIANPQSYDEYRDKLVSEKIAAKAESRIRARREQPKVNKALAERLRKAEEREEAAARKKAARAAARGDAAAAEEEADSRKSKEPSLMADPRFKAIFENPEFEVDEQSREFALLNPATADNNAAKRAAAAATGRTRTAVESEDEDKGASDSFDDESEDEDDDDDDEKDEDAADADDQRESGDSDDGGESSPPVCHRKSVKYHTNNQTWDNTTPVHPEAKHASPNCSRHGTPPPSAPSASALAPSTSPPLPPRPAMHLGATACSPPVNTSMAGWRCRSFPRLLPERAARSGTSTAAGPHARSGRPSARWSALARGWRRAERAMMRRASWKARAGMEGRRGGWEGGAGARTRSDGGERSIRARSFRILIDPSMLLFCIIPLTPCTGTLRKAFRRAMHQASKTQDQEVRKANQGALITDAHVCAGQGMAAADCPQGVRGRDKG